MYSFFGKVSSQKFYTLFSLRGGSQECSWTLAKMLRLAVQSRDVVMLGFSRASGSRSTAGTCAGLVGLPSARDWTSSFHTVGMCLSPWIVSQALCPFFKFSCLCATECIFGDHYSFGIYITKCKNKKSLIKYMKNTARSGPQAHQASLGSPRPISTNVKTFNKQ